MVTLSRLRAIGCALIPVLLIAAAPVPAADEIPTTFDLRQYAGAPLEVTSFSFAEGTRLACITFQVAAAQELADVSFAVLALDETGAEHSRAALHRSGHWNAGTVVRGDAGDHRANCVAVEAQRADAPVVAVRLTHAVYANGASWDAPSAPLAPIPDAIIAAPSRPITGQPWSPAFHHGYVAVAYGNPDAHIALFEPGATVPSTTLDVGHCCVSALAFDIGGALYAETSTGVQIFLPGAGDPAVRLPQHGFAMAVDGLGTVAAGGGSQGGPVEVYPHGSAAFALDVSVKFGGLAYAPDGTLALANAANSSIELYAAHETRPFRTIAVPGGTTLLAYDVAGRLLAANPSRRLVTVYAPGGSALSTAHGTEARAIAFAPAGRALLGGQGAVRILDVDHPDAPVVPVYGASADRVAAGPDGTFVRADLLRGLVVEDRPSGPQLVIAGLHALQALAVSP